MFALVFNGITTRHVHEVVYTATKLIIGSLNHESGNLWRFSVAVCGLFLCRKTCDRSSRPGI